MVPLGAGRGLPPLPAAGLPRPLDLRDEGRHQDDLADAFRHEPITDVTLFPKGGDLPALAAWPQFARLRTLKLWPDEPREEDLLVFLASPHLSGLRGLEYMGLRDTRVPFAGACRLLAGPRFAGLTSLSILSAGVGDDGAAALAGHPGLSSLSLAYGDIGVAGCRALLASTKATDINLSGNLRRAADGETLAGLLAHVPRLTSLVLGETPFNDRAAVRLSRAPWPALDALTIAPQPLDDATARSNLARMTAEGVRRLAGSPWFQNVSRLELSGHPMGDAGAAALADARLPRLTELTLMLSGITAAGLRRLTDAYSGQLSLLQLYGNPFGDAGARVIADAAWPRMATPGRGTQTGLLMGGCGIGPAGANAIRASEGISATIPELFLGD